MTTAELQTAVGSLLQHKLLNPTHFDAMLGDRPVHIFAKGRYATTADGVLVCILKHSAMVYFSNSFTDAQECVVQRCGQDGSLLAEAYREKYSQLTASLQPHEKNIIGLVIMLGVVPRSVAPVNISISTHIRAEVLDMHRVNYELAHLNDKTFDEMAGEKAYTIAIDMLRMPEADLRKLSDEFVQIYGYSFPIAFFSPSAKPAGTHENGVANWASAAAKIVHSTTAANRARVLLGLYAIVELRVVGFMVA